MSKYAVGMSMLVAALLAPAAARGQGANEGREIIEKVIESWRGRNKQVRAIECRTKVTTFYPRGSVSETHADLSKKHRSGVVPTGDTESPGGFGLYVLDFDNNRVRAEVSAVKGRSGVNGVYLLNLHQVLCWRNNNYSSLYPREGNKDFLEADRAERVADGVEHGDKSLMFLLSVSDLPIRWRAGGVTGEWAVPSIYKQIDEPSAWRFEGRGHHDGRDTVTLSTRNQDDDTSRLVYTVMADAPHSIMGCYSKDGLVPIEWSIWVTYDAAGLDPTSWLYTENGQGDGKASRLKFRVRHDVEAWRFNQTYDAAMFEPGYKPGMILGDADGKVPMKVNRDGSLSPLVPPPRRQFFVILGAAAVGMVLLALAVRAERRGR